MKRSSVELVSDRPALLPRAVRQGVVAIILESPMNKKVIVVNSQTTTVLLYVLLGCLLLVGVWQKCTRR